MNETLPGNQANASTEEKTSQPATCKILVLVLFINLMVTAGGLVVYDRFFAQKIAVLDVETYIKDLKELYIKGEITDADLNEAPRKVKAAVDSVGKNTTILTREAVLKSENYVKVED